MHHAGPLNELTDYCINRGYVMPAVFNAVLDLVVVPQAGTTGRSATLCPGNYTHDEDLLPPDSGAAACVKLGNPLAAGAHVTDLVKAVARAGREPRCPAKYVRKGSDLTPGEGPALRCTGCLGLLPACPCAICSPEDPENPLHAGSHCPNDLDSPHASHRWQR